MPHCESHLGLGGQDSYAPCNQLKIESSTRDTLTAEGTLVAYLYEDIIRRTNLVQSSITPHKTNVKSPLS
jgi:hypothetical protein